MHWGPTLFFQSGCRSWCYFHCWYFWQPCLRGLGEWEMNISDSGREGGGRRHDEASLLFSPLTRDTKISERFFLWWWGFFLRGGGGSFIQAWPRSHIIIRKEASLCQMEKLVLYPSCAALHTHNEKWVKKKKKQQSNIFIFPGNRHTYVPTYVFCTTGGSNKASLFFSGKGNHPPSFFCTRYKQILLLLLHASLNTPYLFAFPLKRGREIALW